MEENLYFTPEEISVIDKNLGYIVFDWPKSLINNIIYKARQKGVEKLYMNSTKTLDSGANDGKVAYLYETLPSRLGFKKTLADLRDKGMEELWVMELNDVTTAKLAYDFVKIAQEDRSFTIDQIPSSLQGAVLSIIGKKDKYLKSELQRVIGILEMKESKKTKESPKQVAKLAYDWNSKVWTGSQRFDNQITETVVLQKIPEQMHDMLLSNPVLKKFWAFLLTRAGHFDDSDKNVVAFALVSMKGKNWVINEIQTDNIQEYLNIRAKYYKNRGKDKTEKVTWDTIKDMLEAQNRSNWIAKLETIPQLKEQIINNPNMIGQLPDNNTDIDKWLQEQQRTMQGAGGEGAIDLMRAVQATNFNKRVFKS